MSSYNLDNFFLLFIDNNDDKYSLFCFKLIINSFIFFFLIVIFFDGEKESKNSSSKIF